MPCSSCGADIDAGDAYCRRCGMGQGPHLPWYYHPAAIAALTLLALGPFSLPLIWRTPKLASRGRWFFTLMTAAYTWYVLAATLRIWNTAKAALGGGVF